MLSLLKSHTRLPYCYGKVFEACSASTMQGLPAIVAMCNLRNSETLGALV